MLWVVVQVTSMTAVITGARGELEKPLVMIDPDSTIAVASFPRDACPRMRAYAVSSSEVNFLRATTSNFRRRFVVVVFAGI